MPPTPNSQESVALHNGLRHNTTVRKELNPPSMLLSGAITTTITIAASHFYSWFDRLRLWIKWNSCLWAAGILSEILQGVFLEAPQWQPAIHRFCFWQPQGTSLTT
jgi:tellurite resistance protein TehA-like permease